MPKKSKKKKKRKKIKKRKSVKRERKVSQKTKKRGSLKSKKKKIKTSISQPKEDGEKIYKTKSEWIKKALVTKNLYEKNTINL